MNLRLRTSWRWAAAAVVAGGLLAALTVSSGAAALGASASGFTAASDPAWSHDGKRIAFVQQRQTETGSVGALFTMRPDGSAQTMIAPEQSRLGWPTWSPDGRRIAFDANGQRIDVVNADGSGLRALVSTQRSGDRGFGLYPAWSPGGRKIAYTEPTGDDSAGSILVMNPDGSRKTYAAVEGDFGAYEMPTWSPDGQRLAFYTVRASDSANDVSPHLAYIQQYGGIVQDLSGRDASEPDWSPDGRRIALASFELATPRVGVLNLRTDRRRFLHTGSHPRWSPDGRRIVFTDKEQIYVMNADGSNVRQLTRSQ